MTNYKGIAAVTQTLSYLMDSAIRAAVPEARITVKRPEEPAAASVNEPRLNIYLVQVTPEATMRSNDLPTRDERGNLLSIPQAPVNLRYLLSFFGSAEKSELMLGASELALREHAVLDPTLVGQALADHPQLQNSGLDEQSPPVRIVPSTVTLEELSRFWSGFLQMPYTVSTLYEARTVILTSFGTPDATLPVRTVQLEVEPGSAAQLDPLPTVQFSASAPATVVSVSGTGLVAGQPVQVAGQWLRLEPQPPAGLRFTLPPDASAGTHTVVLGSVSNGGGARPIPGSRPQVLRIRPQLRSVDRNAAGTGVVVTVAPPVRPGQQIVLSLVGTAPGRDVPAASAQISTTPAIAATQVTFTVPPRLPAGAYLAIVEVEGVASLPEIDDDGGVGPIVGLT